VRKRKEKMSKEKRAERRETCEIKRERGMRRRAKRREQREEKKSEMKKEREEILWLFFTDRSSLTTTTV
jgi:hypothetical protein